MVKINEGIAIDKNATSLRTKKFAEQAVKLAMPSNIDTISQDKTKVKKQRKQFNIHNSTKDVRYDEIIRNATKDGRVLDYNTKKEMTCQ